MPCKHQYRCQDSVGAPYGVLVKWLSREPVTLVSRVQFSHTPPYGPLVELDKTSDFQSEDGGFEPRMGHQ